MEIKVNCARFRFQIVMLKLANAKLTTAVSNFSSAIVVIYCYILCYLFLFIVLFIVANIVGILELVLA